MNDATQAALLAAAREHWEKSGSAAFAIPLPDTSPPVYLALGRPEQIEEILQLVVQQPG